MKKKLLKGMVLNIIAAILTGLFLACCLILIMGGVEVLNFVTSTFSWFFELDNTDKFVAIIFFAAIVGVFLIIRKQVNEYLTEKATTLSNQNDEYETGS